MLSKDVSEQEKMLEKIQYLFQIGQYGEVIACSEQFGLANTINCDIFYIQAMSYMHLGEYNKGLELTKTIKMVDKDYIGAYMAEAYIYKKQGEFTKEAKLLRKIIAHIEKLQIQEKSKCYQQSLSEAWSLLGSFYTMTGQPPNALEAFFTASCLEQDEKKKIQEYSNALFVTNYMADISREDMKKLHAGFQSFFSSTAYFPQFVESKKTLRIGYVSPDFRQHPVAYFVLSLLEKFNKEKFEIYCYAASEPDVVTLGLQPLATKCGI